MIHDSLAGTTKSCMVQYLPVVYKHRRSYFVTRKAMPTWEKEGGPCRSERYLPSTLIFPTHVTTNGHRFEIITRRPEDSLQHLRSYFDVEKGKKRRGVYVDRTHDL